MRDQKKKKKNQKGAKEISVLRSLYYPGCDKALNYY